MLHKQTISPFLEEVLKRLMQIKELKDFRLVGGTALSLLLGHRKSLDIDMFTAQYIKSNELMHIMKLYYPRNEIRDISFGVQMYLPKPGTQDELKVDLMCNEDYIRPVIEEEGIRIAQIEDISAMKLEAITTRKEKKDYWDIAELLGIYSLDQLTIFYKERYPWNDLRAVMENLLLFEKCDGQFDPECLNNKDWPMIKTIITKAFDKFVNHEKKRINPE